MLTTLRAFCLQGIEAKPLRVEVDVHRGLPSFAIVGLPDGAVREARERIRAALVSSGFEFPLRRIVVNLAPASYRRMNPSLDLPIAAALLCASGQIEPGALEHAAFIGELGLDGSVRPARGVLAMVEQAKRSGSRSVFLPAGNGAEAALVEGIDLVPLDRLSQLPAACSGEFCPPRPAALALGLDPPPGSPDLADLRGQPELRRALELAAAGAHSLLLLGPPGAGKSLAASRLPSILPPLHRAEAIEVARIASATGRLEQWGRRGGRPFRAPHYSISAAGLLGGGAPVRPGEVTLAHRGVLYLDEVADFSRDALEALAGPLQCGKATVTRAGTRHSFPADFMLVAAARPCPCGRGEGEGHCSCAPYEVQRYRGRIGAALGGAVDIALELRAPTAAEIGGPPGESSAAVGDRVCRARELQERRLGAGRSNAQMSAEEARGCPLSTDAAMLLAELYANRRLGGRAHEGALRLAQTIVDLEAAPLIEERHLAEALRLLPASGLSEET